MKVNHVLLDPINSLKLTHCDFCFSVSLDVKEIILDVMSVSFAKNHREPICYRIATITHQHLRLKKFTITMLITFYNMF